MAAMTLGGMLEADRRLREYEARIRIQKKLAKDRVLWESYERELEGPSGSQVVSKDDK